MSDGIGAVAVIYDHDSIVRDVFPLESESALTLRHAGLPVHVELTADGAIIFDFPSSAIQENLERIRVRDPRDVNFWLSAEQIKDQGVISFADHEGTQVLRLLGNSEGPYPYASMSVLKSKEQPEIGACIRERLR